jgi:hypothetical protein
MVDCCADPLVLTVVVVVVVVLVSSVLCVWRRQRHRVSATNAGASVNADNERRPLLSSSDVPGRFVRVRALALRRTDAQRDRIVERAARSFFRGSSLRFMNACVQIGERVNVFHYRLVDAVSRDVVLLAVHTDCAERPLLRKPERMRAAASVLSKLQMTGLLPCDKAAWAPDRDVLFFVTPFVPAGSLRDALRRTDPLDLIAAKRNAVGQPSASDPVPLLFDLLCTLRLLARIGVPLHHVHAGNVFLNTDGRPPMIDVSSALLGEPPRYADLMRTVGRGSEHARRRGAAVDAAVVAFGTVVYELFAGDEFESTEQIRNEILPVWVRGMLAQIFSDRLAPPTLATLCDVVSAQGRHKERTYRDRTAPLDAAEVEFLARATKAAEAFVKAADESESGTSTEASDAATTTTAVRPQSKRRKKKPNFEVKNNNA